MSERYAPIIDNEQLVRDNNSNAVLNTDMTALESYRARREKLRKQQEEFETLKTDVSEIKDLLKQILNRD